MERLVFAVNGERFELNGIDPSTTVLEFLRTQTRFKGAKLGCGEGGCGACVVLLSRYDPLSERVEECSINACLTLLCSINLCSVTTTEGLGNSKDGFNSIHKRLSGFHASQCGFCTPGMCMSIFSALVNADKITKPEPPSGFSKLSMAEAEKAIAGNICRCTGYRPIIDASKSFACDVDIEDLGLNAFWSKGEDADVEKLPTYRSGGICTFPDFLKTEIRSYLSSIHSPTDSNGAKHSSWERCWYRPHSIDELYDLLSSGQSNEYDVKLVVGNTGSGVYKDTDLYEKYIDLSGIPEMSLIKKDNTGIEIGAAVTISKCIEVLKEGNETLVFSKIADHMNKVASHFVRNTASLGGNIIMAQRSQFPSDIATILLAAGSSVSIQKVSERLVLTLEEFLEMPPCDQRTLLLSIRIPCWNSVSNSSDSNGHLDCEESTILFETYRASPRPLGNAVAYLNSAFLAQISFSKNSGDHSLDNLQLAFGAYGCEHAIRARKVEKFLVGKKVTASVLIEAIRLLRETIVPEEGTPNSAYRSSLAVAFLFRFLYPLANGLSSEYCNGYLNGYVNSTLDVSSNDGSLDQLGHRDLPLSSSQVVGFNKEYFPVGEPTTKAGAELQASGEALFVDDIPSPKDCLYGAFIYGTKPMAHVKGIQFKSTLVSQKVVTIISAKDIPNGGNNFVYMSGREQLFADSHIEYAGQPVGLVIAETQKLANLAAKQAVIEYGWDIVGPAILTIEDAVKRSSFFQIPPYFYPKQVGDFATGMTEADHKILSAEVKLGSQYYFYMETQTALAVPDEDNCMVVYTSNQSSDMAQGIIANCLGVPHHNVRAITRRVGGGFGGKVARAITVATACAFAAFKLQRPVRMYLDRKTDMIMAGGRHPMKINYSVGYKSDGKITALHIDLLINAGISEDVSPMMPYTIIGALKKYNWGAFSFDAKVCKTNTPSRGAMRAPGELQGSYIAEAIIEHVASALSFDANSIRTMNLHTMESLQLYYEGSAGEASEYTLPSIFNKLAASENYVRRVQMIHEFNSCNKWKKRGISCVPSVYQLILRPTPGKVGILNDGSIVVEVGGIELGQGLWTKVKQMTAFALRQLSIDGCQDLLERVRVIQADSLSLIQGGYTAGSTTSEASCEAVRLACNVLVDRLRPLKDRLQEQSGSITWDTLIAQANLQAVNLSASNFYVPEHSSSSYLNFGAATSEVEIDLLTGATTIIRTDITYDCGQSLNPAVDLGQIEGAFVQGIGFFMQEEYLSNSDGLVVSDGTWTYKVPTVDTIPKNFNVEILNSGHHKKRVLSSKASGEPPLLLAASVHCATREAIKAARSEFSSEGSPSMFELRVPATMPVVKELCGLDNVGLNRPSFIMLSKLSLAQSPFLFTSSSSSSCLGFSGSIAWRNALSLQSAGRRARQTSRSCRGSGFSRIRCDASREAEQYSVLTATKTATEVRAVVVVKPKAGGVFAHLDQAGILGTISDVWDDFRDRTMRLELVSSELDPNTGKEKTVEGFARDGRQEGGVVTYAATFKLPKGFGEIGGVLVRNEHHQEMYLEKIVLITDDDTPPVNVDCRSWLASESDSKEKRIFFTTKSYLPNETPDGLVSLRQKELENLRGNGKGERKKFERIYDYDVYNDLGNPDKSNDLKRPVLGGSKDLPYPRRGRTGRRKTNTDPLSERPGDERVPRDEAFSELKGASFMVKTVRSVLHSLIPALETLTDKTASFPHFKDITQLYDDGVVIPKQEGFSSVIPRIIKSIEDLKEGAEELLLFEVPALINKDSFSWFRDEEFARQTLAGVNPLSIQLVTEFPFVSKLDPKIYGPPESAITEDIINEQIRGVMSAREALEQKRLFQLDYHDLYLPYVHKVRELENVTLYGSRTLFFLTNDGTLRPLAIELTRPASPTMPQWKRVYKHSWNATESWLWKLAKAHVLAHDSGYHQLVSHWLRTHCCAEPYVIAMNRQLSAMHPIYRLMRPHFRYTMEINALARQMLINAGGVIESNFGPGKYSIELSSVAYREQWRFDMEALPADLIRRGMAVEDPAAEHGLRLTVEDYPYANDGLLVWSSIEEWVSDYVNHYYPSPTGIKDDQELQNWWNEVRCEGHGDKKDEPWWPTLNTQADLIHVLTTIIWVNSGHHAAVNFGQYPYAGYFPNRPTTARKNMPSEDEGSEAFVRFWEKPEQALLECFPSQFQATSVMAVLDVLSTHAPDEEYIGGEPEPAWASDKVINAAFERFSGRMKEIEGTIDARNINPQLQNRCGAGMVPYELLKPFSEAGVTGKGVPNSISI